MTHLEPKSVRDDGVREEKKEFSYLSSSLLENLKSSLLHLVPIYSSKLPLILAASHHLQPMAGEGNPKTVATTPATTHPANPPAINAPNSPTEAMMEDAATFMQPLAMVPAEGSSGGPVGATLRSAELPGRPTRGRDIQCPRSAARSPSPLKIARSRARAQSPYGRPSKEAPAPSRSVVQ